MRVLVLDGSSMVRRFIREELEWGDYEVLEAANPEEAREVLLTEPGISLLTLSMVLEGMEAFDFLAEIMSREFLAQVAPLGNDNLHAVFVTSNDNDEDRLRGYYIGAADFIQKPWQRGDLLAHVNSLLGCRTEMQDLNVLVVDDSRTIRRFVRSGVSRLGAQVQEADDGDTAWQYLQNHDVDLVLTDLHMARMGGDELCLKIRGNKRLSELPVIFLSSNADDARTLALFKIGATDYLTKPCIQEELMARLRVHLERELLVRTLREVSGIEADPDIEPVVGPGTGGEACRVLLVDDAEVNLAVGRQLLGRLGCDVATATCGRQVVDTFARARSRPWDLVLMDLAMPNLDGVAATREIRRLEVDRITADPDWGAPLTIIALTSSPDETQLADCIDAGINDFLAKPFRVDKVRPLIEKWAGQPA
ncbi:response regulator [bacterium]|nr:response regulator [bacterium]